MKILPLIALSLGLGIMPAAAQPLLPVFHLNAAAAFPLSPHSFSNGHGVGYGMALGAGVSVLERADVYVEGSLAAFPIDLGQVRGDVRATGGNVSFTGAAIGLRVHFPTPNGTFYVSPRGSMERYKVTDLLIQSSDTTISQAGGSEWAPAASIGAGITFDLIPQAGLFVEADYSLVFAEQQTLQYTPIRVGLTIRPGRAE
ncbi:MAG TPA: hypothetical protein VFG50_04975 [Rhodothermales bacterium]|nr:hypothetical protein [Rhodothermales bacterium]